MRGEKDIYDYLFSNYEMDVWSGAPRDEMEAEVKRRKERFLVKHGYSVEEALRRWQNWET